MERDHVPLYLVGFLFKGETAKQQPWVCLNLDFRSYPPCGELCCMKELFGPTGKAQLFAGYPQRCNSMGTPPTFEAGKATLSI